MKKESNSILHNLADLGGNKVGESIANHIEEDAYIQAVFFCGPPGSGKSTVRGQLKNELYSKNEDIVFVDVSFDEALAEAIREFYDRTSANPLFIEKHPELESMFNEALQDLERRGVIVGSPDFLLQLGNIQWKYVSHKLKCMVDEAYENARSAIPDKRILLMVEVPAIALQNVGKSTIIEFIIQNNMLEHPQNLFIFINPDARILNIASQFRKEIVQAELSEIPKILEKFGITVDENISLEELQQIKLRAEQAAPEFIIQQVNNDVRELAHAFAQQNPELFKLLSSLVQEPSYTEKMRSEEDLPIWISTATLFQYIVYSLNEHIPVMNVDEEWGGIDEKAEDELATNALNIYHMIVVHNILQRAKMLEDLSQTHTIS